MDKLTYARSLLSAHAQAQPPVARACLSFGKLGLQGAENHISKDNQPRPGIHEIYGQVGQGASSLFAFLLARQIMQTDNRTIFYIEHTSSDQGRLFSLALPQDLQERLVGISIRHPADLFWCFEETLRSEQAACVICEVPGLDLTASRRLQLACEQGRTFGFALCGDSRALHNSSAAQTRWRISGKPPHFWSLDLIGGRGVRPYPWTVMYDRATFSISVVPPIGNGTLYPECCVA